MNKKVIGLFLTLGLAAVLSACGGGGTAPTESPAAPASPAASPSP